MKLQNMTYGTLILLIIFCIIDSIETKISGFFTRKPQKTYRYFSGFLIGTFPGLANESPHKEIESISDNVRYDSVLDIWEVFKISHDNSQDMDIHQGRRGNWVIVDDEKTIKKFQEMYFQGINSFVTPIIQT